MKASKSNLPLLVSGIYVLAVVVCMLFAFNYRGSINVYWTLSLIVLTLPLSMLSIFFVLPLIHGEGLEFFAVVYLGFAGVNALTLYLICSFFVRRYKDIEQTELQS
jgi:hypothetical protein